MECCINSTGLALPYSLISLAWYITTVLIYLPSSIHIKIYIHLPEAKEFPSSLADLMKLAAADAGESDKTLATDEKSMEEDVRRQAAALQRDRMPQEEEEESPEVIEIEEIEQIEPIKEVEVEESTEERDVVYSWPRAAKSQENLLRTHVRSWADQAFAGRGAGIEATDSADGVSNGCVLYL